MEYEFLEVAERDAVRVHDVGAGELHVQVDAALK